MESRFILSKFYRKTCKFKFLCAHKFSDGEDFTRIFLWGEAFFVNSRPPYKMDSAIKQSRTFSFKFIFSSKNIKKFLYDEKVFQNKLRS